METEKNNILDWLYSLHRFGIKPGLDRITKILDYLGNPHKRIQTIHIAGTNGKGTTATNIASIYSTAGYKTGLYTSPHLIDFNERIQLNGKMIPDDYLIDILKSLKSIQEETNATFFELTTAVAFKYFEENKTDISVIEAGMGGLNDATNVITPLLSIITSIGLDHKEYLGDTIEKIARDKAGIFKSKSKALVSDLNLQLTKLFEEIADKSGTHLYFLDDIARINDLQLINYRSLIDFTSMSKNYIVHSPLLGKHQGWNIVAAATSVKLLNDLIPIHENHIKKGIENILSNFKFTGRFQIINQKPLTIIDVAHNYESFNQLIGLLNELELSKQSNLCFAIMQDKDIPSIVSNLEKHFKKIIITKPKIERAADPEILLGYFSQKNKVEIVDNTQKCVEYFKDSTEPIIYAGSFYLIGEILEAYQKHKESLRELA